MRNAFNSLIANIESHVTGISPKAAQQRLQGDQDILLLDVREREAYVKGYIPGAMSLPRGFLELRIENIVLDRAAPILVYGNDGQGLLAAYTLQEMGYQNVTCIRGGYNAWTRAGLPTRKDRPLSNAEVQRFSRHLLISEVGEKGQAKLLDARVLLIGAGGLGCPTALYLAAAGVGTLGIADADVVDVTNLQRQVLHGTSDVGRPKVISAYETLKGLNPGCRVIPHQERIAAHNVMEVLDGYDIVVNGCDNFPTRYLINDACVFARKPLVDGSIYQFDGQATVFMPFEGPCYRCLYPEIPSPELRPASCADAGVLGVLPGTIGLVQATETIKLILGQGDPLIGRLLIYDALGMTFNTFKVRRDPNCPVCGEHPTITELVEYEDTCVLNLNDAAD